MTTQFSRRDLVRGILGGAASLAFAPISLANLGPPPGMIALRFNENPYGPSPGALKAAAEAAAPPGKIHLVVGTDTQRVGRGQPQRCGP